MELLAIGQGRIALELWPEEAARIAQALGAAEDNVMGLQTAPERYGLGEKQGPAAEELGRYFGVLGALFEASALACSALASAPYAEECEFDVKQVRRFGAQHSRAEQVGRLPRGGSQGASDEATA